MFSLFLVEHHFQEHSIGLITTALTIGTIAGTLPASFLSRILGLRTMMLAYTFARSSVPRSTHGICQMPAQIGLAFLTGVAMSIWPVCFSPTLFGYSGPLTVNGGIAAVAAMPLYTLLVKIRAECGSHGTEAPVPVSV